MPFNFISSLLIAFWIVLISVLSIQNVSGVSLHFLIYDSIRIPFGVVIALSLAFGLIIQPFLISILKKNGR